MKHKKIVMAASGVALASAILAGGSALAFADTTTPSPSASSSTNTDGQCMGGHAHTAVTGDELTKVTDAVTAYDSTISVTQVRKDPDGSYDVDGTKDGTTIRLDVSADLATITEHTGMGRGPDDSQSGTTSSDPTDANTSISTT